MCLILFANPLKSEGVGLSALACTASRRGLPQGAAAEPCTEGFKGVTPTAYGSPRPANNWRGGRGVTETMVRPKRLPGGGG